MGAKARRSDESAVGGIRRGATLEWPARAEPLVIGYSSVTSVFLPFRIARDLGVYKKEGLDTQQAYLPSWTSMTQAIFTREVAISPFNSGSVMSSGLPGSD
jgi:ABC-type nitrate/sulfonate/bicarbonate transport system substrate-binding protein